MKRFIMLHITLAAMLGVLLRPLAATEPSHLLVEVTAGEHAIADVPLSVELPQDMANANLGMLALLDDADPDHSLSAQIEPARNGRAARLWFVLDQPLAAESTRRFHIVSMAGPTTVEDSESVTVRNIKSRLVAKRGSRPVLVYNHGEVKSPEGIDQVYNRSGYIHPIYTPEGVTATGDFCADHAHQHGIFMTYPKAQFAGHAVDFWNQHKRQGDVDHVEVVSVGSGSVFGEFVVRLRHQDETDEVAVTALEETWQVRVFNLPREHMFEITSTQTTASKRPVKLEKYHYGGMAYRAPCAWAGKAGGFLTSDGLDGSHGNHSRPRWVETFGRPEGEFVAGVTVMQHPSNFRYPAPARLHSGFNYFCFAPMVREGFAIEQGKPLVSRYRYLVHDGEIDVSRTEALWRNFSSPVKVEVFTKPHPRQKTVIVLVPLNGEVAVDGQVVKDGKFKDAFKRHALLLDKAEIKPKDVRVCLIVDAKVLTGKVQDIIQAAGDAGFENFAFRLLERSSKE